MFKAFLKKFEETTDKIGKAVSSEPKSPTTETKPPSDGYTPITDATTSQDAKVDTGKAVDFGKQVVDAGKVSVDAMRPVVSATAEALKKSAAPLRDININWSDVFGSSGNVVIPPEFYRQNVDFSCGAGVLAKYHLSLNELRTNNSNLGQKAEAVDRKLPTVVRVCLAHNDAWKKLNSEMTKLPEMIDTIGLLRSQIDAVLSRIDELEVMLGAQVETQSENEILRYKKQVVAETTKISLLKQRELEQFDQELAIKKVKHEREQLLKERSRQMEEARLKVKQDEEARRKEQQEAEKKSNDLQAAIMQQMEDYKKRTAAASEVPKPVEAPKVAEAKPVEPLEQIVPEDNNNLNDFLSGVSPSPLVVRPDPGDRSLTDTPVVERSAQTGETNSNPQVSEEEVDVTAVSAPETTTTTPKEEL